MCVCQGEQINTGGRTDLWELILTRFTFLISLVDPALRRHISKIILRASHSILKGSSWEREGNVAVYSLCVCAHAYAGMHSLNNKSETKHRILKPSRLKDNTGKKWSWFKRLWPLLCSCTALLEITFIAKKQAWLQGCLITHNDTKSILFIPTSNSTFSDADLHVQKRPVKIKILNNKKIWDFKEKSF